MGFWVGGFIRQPENTEIVVAVSEALRHHRASIGAWSPGSLKQAGRDMVLRASLGRMDFSLRLDFEVPNLGSELRGQVVCQMPALSVEP